MPYKARNTLYLRISKKIVLPIYLYLDEKHLDWMSDEILQHVLEDIRPNILSKLRAESEFQTGGGTTVKKGSLETHRGSTYQFCYFLRKAQPHSVALKTRAYITVTKDSKRTSPPIPSSSKPQRSKRKAKEKSSSINKKRKTKGKGREIVDSDDAPESGSEDFEDGDEAEGSEGQGSRRSGRRRPQMNANGDHANPSSDVDMDPPYPPSPQNMDFQDLEIEEDKPKPVLQVKFQNFNIFGNCCCIVVEPWPPLTNVAPRTSVAPTLPRAPSIAPLDFIASTTAQPLSNWRSKTPLFLPDDDEHEQPSATPAPFLPSRPPVPLFDDDDDNEGEVHEMAAMLEFSQVLTSAGDFRASAIEDDEDMEGSALFGDADEVRELDI